MASPERPGVLSLSECGVSPSAIGTLPVDGFSGLVTWRPVSGHCVRYPVITTAPVLGFIPSGGALNTDPVAYSTSVELEFARAAARVEVAGDVRTNVSLVHHVLRDQVLAKAQFLQMWADRALWADPLPADAPEGMAAFAAAHQVLQPLAGVHTPLTTLDLQRLRLAGRPWLPTSPFYFVMHPKLYFRFHDLAAAQGFPWLYVEDPFDGVLRPRCYDAFVVACEHISLEEGPDGSDTSAYLVRVGDGPDDPVKIGGFYRAFPAGQQHVVVTPGSSSSGTEDIEFVDIALTFCNVPGSRSSVSRLERIASPA